MFVLQKHLTNLISAYDTIEIRLVQRKHTAVGFSADGCGAASARAHEGSNLTKVHT